VGVFVEWDYMTDVVRFDVMSLHCDFFSLACQRNGNVLVSVDDGIDMFSPQYKFMCHMNTDVAGLLMTDVWDQIVAISFTNRLNLWSADGKTHLFDMGLGDLSAATVNMYDGTLCCLEFCNSQLTKFKNKY
jgi:hypothetical protein